MGCKPLVFCSNTQRAIIYRGSNYKQGILVVQLEQNEAAVGAFTKIFILMNDVMAKYFILDYGHILKASGAQHGFLEVYRTDGTKIYEIEVMVNQLGKFSRK